MVEIQHRVRGSLLGGAVGDALGWPIEFMRLDAIRERYGPEGSTGYVQGAPEITDDTQMTLFTAEGLLRCAPTAQVGPVMTRAYLRWLKTQRQPEPDREPDGWLASLPFLYAVRAPGNACMSGLQQQARGYLSPVELGVPGQVNPKSKGCGTVMRSAPFGLVGFGPKLAFDLSAHCAQLTHGHPTGYLAAGAFAALIDRVTAGQDLRAAVVETIDQVAAVSSGAAVSPGAETADILRRALAAAEEAPATPEGLAQLGEGWIAEECLAIAVYCGLTAARTGDLRAALLLSVNHSGDSDSTGAVTGNLLGAAFGAAALPADWVRDIEGHDTLLQVADDLLANFRHRDRSLFGNRYPLDEVSGNR